MDICKNCGCDKSLTNDKKCPICPDESSSAFSDGLSCAFCKKTQTQVRQLIKGDDACICNECVMTCVEVIRDDMKKIVDGMKATLDFAR